MEIEGRFLNVPTETVSKKEYERVHESALQRQLSYVWDDLQFYQRTLTLVSGL